jgi:hypothetical protein
MQELNTILAPHMQAITTQQCHLLESQHGTGMPIDGLHGVIVLARSKIAGRLEALAVHSAATPATVSVHNRVF